MKDKALIWFSTYLENPDRYSDILNNYDNFKTLFINTFGDPDRSIIAASRITQLKHGRRPVASYAADFRQLASDLTWNDSALIHQFRSGLNVEVKDMLLHYDHPATLDELINLSIKIDNRIFEHRQELRLGFPRPVIPQFQPQQPNAIVNPDPMDVSAIRQRPIGKLNDEEREYRKMNGLCMYCGEQGHLVNICPRLAIKNKKTNISNINRENVGMTSHQGNA